MCCDDDKIVAHVGVWYEAALHVDPEWSDLPRDGVLAVKLIYRDGAGRILQGDDWYFTAAGPADRIYGSTNRRAEIARYPGAVVLRGRWTDDATYHRVVQEAMAWRP